MTNYNRVFLACVNTDCILLCAQTDKDIARYSILKGNEQIFASKYKLLLPSEEELAKEISRQKEIFQLQQEK